MGIVSGFLGHEHEISELFSTSFTASEGAGEGKLIGELATNLMETPPAGDLFVFSNYEDQSLAGCIMFSRLTYEQDDRAVFLLAPVAVRPDRQNKGMGQKLISFGLNELRRNGIDLVLTYGDPNYYSKVGFQQISQDLARPPLKLDHPFAWQGQSLCGSTIAPLSGPSRCAKALDKPELW